MSQLLISDCSHSRILVDRPVDGDLRGNRKDPAEG